MSASYWHPGSKKYKTIGLIAVFLVCCIAFFAVIHEVRRIVERQRAYTELVNVTYTICSSLPTGFIGWFYDSIGAGEFYEIDYIVLSGDETVTNETLKIVSSFPELKGLSLGSDSFVSDEGMKEIAKLCLLEELSLDGSKISDNGLFQLKEMTQLRSLVLSNTQISDAGLNHLKGLRNLKKLDLRNCPISDESIENLQKVLGDCSIRH